jgi:hypothetical protein
LWIPALGLAAVGWAAVDEHSGLPAWRRLRADLTAARARIEILRGDIEALRREAEALQGDDFALERAIREDLGLARAGESVVRLDGRRPGPARAAGRARGIKNDEGASGAVRARSGIYRQAGDAGPPQFTSRPRNPGGTSPATPRCCSRSRCGCRLARSPSGWSPCSASARV